MEMSSVTSFSNSLKKASSCTISFSSMPTEVTENSLRTDCKNITLANLINSQPNKKRSENISAKQILTIPRQTNGFSTAQEVNSATKSNEQFLKATSSPASQDPVLMAKSTDEFVKKLLFGKVKHGPNSDQSIPVPTQHPSMPYAMFLSRFPYNWNEQPPSFVYNTGALQPFAYPFPVIHNSYIQSSMFNPSAFTPPQTPFRKPAKKSATAAKKFRRTFSRVISPSNTSSSSFFTKKLKPNYIQQDLDLGFIKAPVVYSTDKTPMTVYFTKNYCFSNHYPCDMLAIDGIKYLCTEQYYIYYKAHLFGDKNSALAVMSTTDPKVMKKIGAAILNFDEKRWLPVSIQVMVIACQRKYEQNPSLRRQLFSTADTLLVEANPVDERWGIGLPMNSMLMRDKRNWRGQNIMGRLLTMLRDRLLKRPQFAAERKRMKKRKRL